MKNFIVGFVFAVAVIYITDGFNESAKESQISTLNKTIQELKLRNEADYAAFGEEYEVLSNAYWTLRHSCDKMK